MFIEALFMIAKKLINPHVHLTDRQNVVYPHNVILLSVEKNEVIHATFLHG